MPHIPSIVFEALIAFFIAVVMGLAAQVWLGDSTGMGYVVGLLFGVIIVLMWYRPAQARRRKRLNVRIR